ncbi:MAG TPA: CBS domain-containing protein [Anaeromyxobacteraceae bacterium]|nr:CBS domain-containing protein [Anaeromyxobacteraceae bacterium]
MADPVPFQDLPVDKLMTAKPQTLDPDSTLADAATALLEGGFRHLPVVDDARRPVGIISERDLRARLGTDLYGFTQATVEALSEPVSGVMTPDPITVPLGTRTAAVLDTFADERVGALLVVDASDRICGVLSYVDLLLWLRDHPSGSEELPPRSEAGRPAPEAPARGARRRATPRPRRRKAGAKRPSRRPKRRR